MDLIFATPVQELLPGAFGAASYGMTGCWDPAAPNTQRFARDVRGTALTGSYADILAQLPASAPQAAIVLFGNAGGENAFLRELHRRLPGLQIFCDPSHIGGRRELIAPLSQQAMDLGLDGLIVEAHCSPDCAWSDKAQQVTPQGLAYICRNLVIRETNATTESLTELRSQIDKLDDELLELLSRRMRVSRDIGQYKKEHNMPVLQAQRYGELLTRRADQAVRMGMDREFMRSVLQAIHEESIRQQMAVLGE